MGGTQKLTTKGTPILEYTHRKFINVSSNDFVWNSASTKPTPFKIVTSEDCYLNVLLADEEDLGSASNNLAGAAQGANYFPFKAGEGSNAKVIKVYHDAGNTIGGDMWAVI